MRWLVVSLLLATLILVPFFLFESYFNELGVRIAAGEVSPLWATLAISGLLGSDVVLPIPSSVVSAAAGMLLGLVRGTVVIWVGMTVSCLVGHAIGARSAEAARRFVGEEGLRRAANLAARYGNVTLAVCRPVPVLAEASVIFAGVMHMPLSRFLVICGWSNLGVAVGYAALGAYSMRVDSFLLAFAGALLVPGLAALAARLWLNVRS